MLTSSTDTDDGPRVLALERHQDVAGAQIGGVGVLGVARSASVLGRLPRWMRIVRPERDAATEEARLGFGRDEEVRHRSVEQVERLHCLIVRMRVRPHGCGDRTASCQQQRPRHQTGHSVCGAIGARCRRQDRRDGQQRRGAREPRAIEGGHRRVGFFSVLRNRNWSNSVTNGQRI